MADMVEVPSKVVRWAAELLEQVETAACSEAAKDLRAALPWEPSEQDITDYCLARGWREPSWTQRQIGREFLVAAHENGYDAVPRKLVSDG